MGGNKPQDRPPSPQSSSGHPPGSFLRNRQTGTPEIPSGRHLVTPTYRGTPLGIPGQRGADRFPPSALSLLICGISTGTPLSTWQTSPSRFPGRALPLYEPNRFRSPPACPIHPARPTPPDGIRLPSSGPIRSAPSAIESRNSSLFEKVSYTYTTRPFLPNPEVYSAGYFPLDGLLSPPFCSRQSCR